MNSCTKVFDEVFPSLTTSLVRFLYIADCTHLWQDIHTFLINTIDFRMLVKPVTMKYLLTLNQHPVPPVETVTRDSTDLPFINHPLRSYPYQTKKYKLLF